MKAKAIIKRPRIHYVFIFGYLLAPVANLLLLRAFTDLSLNLIMSRMWLGYGPLATIWLFTAPLIGISLFFVHKVTWYAFIAHSSLILVDFVLKWVTRPGYYASTIDGWMNVLIFAGNLLLVAIIGYIVQRDFRAPYFQVLQRHWREKRRIPINYKIGINGTNYPISDLSIGGCFVTGETLDFEPGAAFTIDLVVGEFHFQCRGRVMRVAPAGVGVMFTKMSFLKKRQLSGFLKLRFALRYQVDLSGTWTQKAASLRVKILDISRGGSFLEAPVAHIEIGEPCELNFEIDDHVYELKSKVAWLNPEGSFGKPVGFGLTFTPTRYLMIRHLIRNHGVLTLTR
jgi:Tfp pilus assembly protein PilZ